MKEIKHYLTKNLNKIISLVLILNFIVTAMPYNIFASNNSLNKNSIQKNNIQTRNNKFNFDWQKTLSMLDNLNTAPRPNGTDEVFLTWDVERDTQGSNLGIGNFELTYNIDDKKAVKMLFEKQNDKIDVSYYIKDFSMPGSMKNNGYSNAVDSLSGYQVYKPEEGKYINPTIETYPPVNDNFKIWYEKGEDGKEIAKQVKFTISKGNGFSFKYKNNTIKFKWNTDGKLYFSTNGVKQGNIYEFNLKLTKDNAQQASETLQIFNGININNLKVTPKANDGKDIIDQTSRPISEYPGDNAKIEVEFDMPKFWNNTKNIYEFVDGDEGNPENASVTQVVFNLNHSENNQKIQIIIDDIYKDFKKGANLKNNARETALDVKVATSSNAKVKAKRSTDNNKIYLEISDLDSGIIYNSSTVSLARPTDPKFLTTSLELPIGKFYTFPKFSIVSFGSEEFYLKLEPFKGYNGYYTIRSGDTNATLNRWAVYEDKKFGEEEILIPVNLNAVNKQTKFFDIEFRFTPQDDTTVSNEQVFKSQILKFTPSDEDVILSTPNNLKVNGQTTIDLSAIHNPITNKNEINIELKWDMAYKDVIETLIKNNRNKPLEVFYTFYKSDTANSSNSLDGKEFLKIKVTASKPENGNLSFEITEVENKNILQKFEIEENNVIAGNERKIVITPKIELNIPVSPKENPTEAFLYPSINFVSLKGEYTINGDKITTSSSLPVSITINDVLKVSIPQPQNVKIENTTATSFDATFKTMKWEKEGDALYTYNKKVLEKIGLALKEDSIDYDFYISQNKELIDDLIKGEESVNPQIKINDYANKVMTEITVTSEEKDWLREGKVLKVENVVQNQKNAEKQVMTFKGLDKNQIYYIVIKAFVTPYQENDKKEEYKEESAYSTILNATTLIEDEGPDESEKNPAAPKNFKSGEVGVNYSNLLWDKPIQISQDSKLEYQFIRLRGQQLNEEFLKERKSFEETWNSITSSSKFGFKTTGNKIEKYISENNIFKEAKKEELEYIDYSNSKGHILDKTLSPNQIYFYYIRTVRVVNGEDKAFSTWVPLSVTTKNVQPPKNLEVDLTKTYDKTKEVPIKFELPKLSIEELKEKYTLHYSIKKDTGNWVEYKIPYEDAEFVQNEDGTIQVNYIIKNLDHGSLYSIRVRMYSLDLKVYSDYSNEITHKTDIDKEQNEYDEIIKDWEESYKSLLEKLKNEPYWLINNNLTTTKVLYRPGYIENIINSTTSSNIHLEVGKDGVNKEYYIPASELKKIFENNKSLKITFKNSEVILTSKSINFEENSAIKTVLEAINEKNVKDYFVKISVNFVEGSFNIAGNNNISPQATVSVNLIGTDKIIKQWDDYLLTILDDLAEENYQNKIRDYIKDLVKEGKTSSEIFEAITRKFEDFKISFFEKVNSQIKSITKRTYPLENLDGNIIFASAADPNTSVKGYVLEAYAWSEVNVKNYGSKKAIYANKTGTYILTGSKLVIAGIGNIENGSLITQIIIKYSLEDYLGKSSNINLKSNITRNSAIGIAARVSGASRTQDPVSYFKTKGVTLSTRNLNSNSTAQEAIFLLMKAYEAKTNTKLETIKIRNYNLTSNIRGISSNYKKAIQVAFDTGIYTNTNFIPNGTITVEEFLQSLAKIIIKVGL